MDDIANFVGNVFSYAAGGLILGSAAMLGARGAIIGASNVKLSYRLKDFSDNGNGVADNYAVLLSGATEERHENNIALAKKVLQTVGYSDKNIIVLDRWGKNRNSYSVDGPSTKGALEKTLNKLSKTIDENDHLFLYVTNHGGISSETGESVIDVPYEDISVSELEKMLEPINAKTGVLLFDQCNGGGFVNLADKKYVAISASKKEESSYSNTFPQAFFNAFRDTVNSDLNMDGKISIHEAFNYALRNDVFSVSGDQHPQIRGGSPKRYFLKNNTDF